MASKLKLTELLYPTSTTPAITLNSDNTVTFGASTTTITNLSATSITDSGNLTFTGTGNRITGDFSNATFANRVAFQTSTTNGNTTVPIIPNGTAITSGIRFFNGSDTANVSYGQLIANGTDQQVALISDKAGTGTYLPIAMWTGGSERLRLDASGNLGLGVTPSAWNSANPAIQFTGEVSISRFGFGRNAYYDGTNYRYITTNVATLYQQSSGNHTWNVAASGTAGNAISFTQAMTLNASGNLGIGTTSPGSYNPSARQLVVANASGAAGMTIRGAAGNVTNIVFANAEDTGVDGLIQYDLASNYLRFDTNGGERARIDSSGNLLVGTTSNGLGGRVVFANSSTNLVLETSGVSWAEINNHLLAGAQYFVSLRYSGTQIGSITGNNTSVTYATSSDYRLKENVEPMTGALAKVASLKPCTYTWKADGSAGQGFIAHELQAVVPDAVTGEKDAVDADGNPRYQGVDTSFLVATLTAAIQEQQAIIETLQTRLTALEGN